MTRGLNDGFPLTVRRPCPRRFQRRSRAILVVGALAVLTVAGQRAPAMQGQPDWWDEISPAGSVNISAFRVSRSEALEYLDRLGLVAGAVADPEVSTNGRDAFHGVEEARSVRGRKFRGRAAFS